MIRVPCPQPVAEGCGHVMEGGVEGLELRAGGGLVLDHWVQNCNNAREDDVPEKGGGGGGGR